MAKSIALTYVLWLVGGWMGLHHLYLGRDRHALVWMFTFGGCFGLGWFRDLVCIPEYVHDANNEPYYVSELKHRAKMDSSPPFHTLRFAGEIIVGMLFGLVARSAIPEPVIASCRFLDILIPVAVALGVCLVGCIGRERVSLKVAVLGSYAGLPVFLNDPSNVTYMALISAIAANYTGKSWCLERRPRHVCARIGLVSLAVLLYSGLWCSAVYHNAYVTTADGQQVKVSEALRHFFSSPAWAETRQTMWRLWSQFLENGPRAFIGEFISAIDPEGQTHAERVLGVPPGASEKEITTVYRRLVREWHPDKHADLRKKKEASQMFMKIQQAYETLSQIKHRRSARNTQQRRPEDEL